MVEFPRREPHGFYLNDAPITDLHEALSVLVRSEGYTGRPAHIAVAESNPNGYEIVVPVYIQGSSGGDRTDIDYYQIDTELAKRLIAERLLKPFAVLTLGSTTYDANRLVPTDEAKERLRTFERELRKKVPNMLTPGIHTDLTGNPPRMCDGREHFKSGRFYVEFTTPLDETCRVYPQQGEIICPYPPPKPETNEAEAA